VLSSKLTTLTSGLRFLSRPPLAALLVEFGRLLTPPPTLIMGCGAFRASDRTSAVSLGIALAQFRSGLSSVIEKIIELSPEIFFQLQIRYQ
jgi:hypothetical protein